MTTTSFLRRWLRSNRTGFPSTPHGVRHCYVGMSSSYRNESAQLIPCHPAVVSHRPGRYFSQRSDQMHLGSLLTKSDDDHELFEDNQWEPSGNISGSNRYSPRNEHQRKLIEYTNTLLSLDDRDYPVGSYPITDIIKISNCIDSWMASGEHRYLGVQQAELLVKRLIMERGGGKSLGKKGTRGNPDVTWDMYHMESLIFMLNDLYFGREFSNRVSSIMSTFEEEYGDSIEVQYKSIISILCKCDTGHASVAAETILHRYESKALTGAHNFDPSTTETYNNLITSWVNSNQNFYPHGYVPAYQHSAHPPANILSEMLSLYKQNPVAFSRIRPDRISFNMVITSLSKHQSRELLTSSSEYLNEVKSLAFNYISKMLEAYEDGTDDCAPDMSTFSTVLNMFQRGPPDQEDIHRASYVLNKMSELSSSGSYEHNVRPAAKHFNIVLGIMGDQKRISRSTLDKAREYLTKMEEMAEVEEHENAFEEDYYGDFLGGNASEGLSSTTSCKPDTVTFNSIIKIASNANMPEVAQDILNDMIERAKSGDVLVKPNIISFNTVLNAWSKSTSPILGTKSTEILNTMQELSARGDFHVKPDNVSLTTVINCLIKSSDRTRGAPVQAEAIIQKMNDNHDYAFKPDTITYTSLIKCWSESGRPKAAKRAEEIIDMLHKRYEEGHTECQLDTMAYNVALNAIAKSGAKNSANRAEAMLQRMIDRFRAGDVDIAPNTRSFSTVINAWSKSGDRNAGNRAEKLLEMMIKLHESGLNDVAPNTVTYSSCINAWSRSRHNNAGRKANVMLKKMDELDGKGYINIRPNIYSFTSAIEAWVNSGDPNLENEASAIFELALRRHGAGDEECKPNARLFNSMLRAIGQSPTETSTKHVRAEKLLNQMKEMRQSGNGPNPDTNTYNNFIHACALVEGDRATKLAAVTCAFNALAEMQQNAHLRPDNYTWPAIWKACMKLLDLKQDIQRINMVFEWCTRNGAISELLFNNMRNFLPPQYLQKKLNTTRDIYALTAHDLPPEWTSNVKLARQRHSKSQLNYLD